MHSSSIGASRLKIGHVLDELEEGRLAPVDVVEDTDERVAPATPSSSLRNAQAISSVEVTSFFAEQRLIARPRGGSDLDRASCLTTSTTGQ